MYIYVYIHVYMYTYRVVNTELLVIADNCWCYFLVLSSLSAIILWQRTDFSIGDTILDNIFLITNTNKI